MDSILASIKTLLGIADFDIVFDNELVMHINSAITILTQLGIGPQIGFKITGLTETWMDFIGDRVDFESIKTIIYLRVRLSFDPPQNSFLVESFKKQHEELEWRLEVTRYESEHE